VRGPERYRPVQTVLEEVRSLVARGVKEFVLLGQNVNSYQGDGPGGRGESAGFAELLGLVDEVPGIVRIGFLTSHPKDLSEEIMTAMAESRHIAHHLHLPLQSGSDRILKLMNRGYTRKYYLDLADKYRTIVTNGALTTDIIVGFPGETEQDFQDTYDVVKNVEFNAGFIFKYSIRPHTEATKMVDDVPKEEKERRHALILELQKKISRKKNAKNR
jgi:tRNA-2-methylthio-N6-dimethylallyladenosine synthase